MVTNRRVWGSGYRAVTGRAAAVGGAADLFLFFLFFFFGSLYLFFLYIRQRVYVCMCALALTGHDSLCLAIVAAARITKTV